MSIFIAVIFIVYPLTFCLMSATARREQDWNQSFSELIQERRS